MAINPLNLGRLTRLSLNVGGLYQNLWIRKKNDSENIFYGQNCFVSKTFYGFVWIDLEKNLWD